MSIKGRICRSVLFISKGLSNYTNKTLNTEEPAKVGTCARDRRAL